MHNINNDHINDVIIRSLRTSLMIMITRISAASSSNSSRSDDGGDCGICS